MSCADSIGAATRDKIVISADGSATHVWDPNALISGRIALATNIPGTFTGANIAPIIEANTFYANGYTGASTISLNVEAGHIWNGHETLGHVVLFSNDTGVPGPTFATPAYDRHATWVGMIIGGRNGGATQGFFQEGIAKNTDLRSGAIALNWSGAAYSLSFGATTSTLAFPYVAGFGTADVINSSWGVQGDAGTDQAGGTDIRSMMTDSLANGNRFTTFVACAGNDGFLGPNSVWAPASGYNGIAVGALQNNGANVYNTVASFSSHGPQDYRGPGGSALLARAGVDIAAPGTNLTSALYGGQSGGNDATLSGSIATGGPDSYSGGLFGTSFAAPITAASVALMHGAAADLGLSINSEDTRVIKANLLNAAAKTTGWNNGQVPHLNGNGGVSTTQALDYYSGAGALDMNRTYPQFLLGQTDIAGMTGGSTPQTVGWDYASVNLGGSTDVVISTPLVAGSQFRATLSWFRERTFVSAFNQSDNGYANLNLQIWDSTFSTLFSESISSHNAVEHLTFNLPTTGSYGIRVQYLGNVFGSLTSEEFGLAWWGVAVPEPSSIAMLVIGLAFVGSTQRRERPVGPFWRKGPPCT